MRYLCSLLVILFSVLEMMKAQDHLVDEVVWMVGDEVIFRSDIENIKLQMQLTNQDVDEILYCSIPEKLAIQKLYLHQAKLDGIECFEPQITQITNSWVREITDQIGSIKQVEEYFGKSIDSLREERKQIVREQSMVQVVQSKLVDGIKIKPFEVREFYSRIPFDSLPFIPTTVELEIITLEPVVRLQEIEEIKRKLREFAELVDIGKRDFSTLARLYSEDKESSRKGGELGFIGKGSLVPEFSNVAFEMNDKRKVSRIVETDYGFHIIQLIEKRNNCINVRHILLKPHYTCEELAEIFHQLDSIRTEILKGKITFENAATAISQDKETRNNHGLMINRFGSSHFELKELPNEIQRILVGMKVGDVSNPFIWVNSKQREVLALVKLKSKVEAHKMTLSEDYQIIKEMFEREKQNQILYDWLFKHRQELYIRIHKDWKNCNFQIKGWIIE